MNLTDRIEKCHPCARAAGTFPNCPKSGTPLLVHAEADHCPAGLFGTAAEPEGWTLRKLAHGAAGVAKALTGVDRAAPNIVEARQAACAQCEHAILKAGVVRKCELCGCAVRLKILVASEKCPAGKW